MRSLFGSILCFCCHLSRCCSCCCCFVCPVCHLQFCALLATKFIFSNWRSSHTAQQHIRHFFYRFFLCGALCIFMDFCTQHSTIHVMYVYNQQINRKYSYTHIGWEREKTVDFCVYTHTREAQIQMQSIKPC